MMRLFVLLLYFGNLASPKNVNSVKGGVSEDILRNLSIDGVKYVEEEMKRALIGVKRMKDLMELNDEKHGNLLRSLMHSRDEKKVAEELQTEVELKLGDVEQDCQKSVMTSWDECRPCLEDTCKAFYTTTCRRGFSTFSFRVQELFRKISSQFQPADNQDLISKLNSGMLEKELVEVEDSFTQLKTRIQTLYDQSARLVTKLHQKFNSTFQAAFTTDVKHKPSSQDEQSEESGFFPGIKLDQVLESVFNFGKSVFKDFSAVITGVWDEMSGKEMQQQKDKRQPFPRWIVTPSKQQCRDLRRNSSQCWQLQERCQSCQGQVTKDCPEVKELHEELKKISQLLVMSQQQYEDVLQIVQHHLEDSVRWLRDMAAQYNWVAQVANSTEEDVQMFKITAVVPQEGEGDSSSIADTTVELNILNSPTFTISVPAEMEVQGPTFLPYVAQEALGMYKQMGRSDPA